MKRDSSRGYEDGFGAGRIAGGGSRTAGSSFSSALGASI